MDGSGGQLLIRETIFSRKVQRASIPLGEKTGARGVGDTVRSGFFENKVQSGLGIA